MTKGVLTMKKLAILLSLILTFSLVGCGDDDSSSEKSSKSKSESSAKFDPNNPDAKEHMDYVTDLGEEMQTRIENQMAKSEAEAEKRKQNFLKNQVKVSDARIDLTENGSLEIKSYGIEYSEFYQQDVITITADYTNHGESDHGFLGFQNYITAYQDGVVLSEVFYEYDKETGTSIKPGKTLEVTFSYLLRNTESDFEIEAEDYSHTLKSKVFDSCVVKLK